MNKLDLINRRLRRPDAVVPSRVVTREEIAAQTAAFLSGGGTIATLPIRPGDRCEIAPGTMCATTRRYVVPVGLASRKALKRRDRVSKAFGGPIKLPGSGTGPHPDDQGA